MSYKTGFVVFGITLVIETSLFLFTDFQNSFETRRIIGGGGVEIRNYPYQLCILLKHYPYDRLIRNNFRGSAAIVSKNWAISVAHLFDYISDYLVSQGRVYLRGNTSDWLYGSGIVDHIVEKKIVHPDYKYPNYDITLLRAKTPFEARYEKPIPVSAKDMFYKAKTQVTTSGWGLIIEKIQKIPLLLRAANLSIVDNKVCSKSYKEIEKITSRMLCAGSSGKGMCKLDDGNPLTYKQVLLGLASWSEGCARNNYPGVYVKLSSFSKWLQDVDKNFAVGISFAEDI